MSGGTKHMEFENLGQLYFPFLKIFYDEKKKHVHTPIILSQECQDLSWYKEASQGVSRGFITAQPIKFSMQLGTTFYLSFITLTFFLSEII